MSLVSAAFVLHSTDRRTWQRVTVATTEDLEKVVEAADHTLLTTTPKSLIVRLSVTDGAVSPVTTPRLMTALWSNHLGRVYTVGVGLRIGISDDDGRTFAYSQPFGNEATWYTVSGAGERVVIAGNDGRFAISTTTTTTFKMVSSGTTNLLNTAFARTESDVIAVGGAIMAWNGTTASPVPMPPLKNNYLIGVHAAKTGPFMAVSASDVVTIDGATATVDDIKLPELRAVWVYPDGATLVVGGSGTIAIKE